MRRGAAGSRIVRIRWAMSARAATARSSATRFGSSTVPERSPTTVRPSVDLDVESARMSLYAPRCAAIRDRSWRPSCVSPARPTVREVQAIGSEPPSSTQIITATVCTDFGSDLGALPASPGVQAAARSRTLRRAGTIVQVAVGRFAKLGQADATPVRRDHHPVRCAAPGSLDVWAGWRASGRAEGVDRSACHRDRADRDLLVARPA